MYRNTHMEFSKCLPGFWKNGQITIRLSFVTRGDFKKFRLHFQQLYDYIGFLVKLLL